jgi:hypothetical protein
MAQSVQRQGERWTARIQFLGRARNASVPHSVETSFGSPTMDTADHSSGDTTVRAGSSAFIIYWRDQECWSYTSTPPYAIMHNVLLIKHGGINVIHVYDELL